MSNTGKLAVLTVLENPLEWESRYRNYHRFRGMIENNGLCRLYTAEIVYGKQTGIRYISGTDDDRKHPVLKLRTDSHIWHKENAINLLLQRVEEENVAWIDSDVIFTNTDWVHQTFKQLESYKVVQLFSHVQNLGYSYQPIGAVRPGYFYQYKTEGGIYGGVNFWGKSKTKIPPEKDAHPGLAFAATKQTLSNLGGLIDWVITGSNDFHMDAAFLGELTNLVDTEKSGYTEGYKKKCTMWEVRADKYVQKNVGYVPGLVCHYWHGQHKNRKYNECEDILKTLNYDPEIDIVRDWQGLYKLNEDAIGLRDAIKKYFRNRNEDDKGEVLIP